MDGQDQADGMTCVSCRRGRSVRFFFFLFVHQKLQRSYQREIFFFCLPSCMQPHSHFGCVVCSGRGAVAKLSNKQHVTRQSDRFSARQREICAMLRTSSGREFAFFFVGLSRADFGLLSSFVSHLLVGKAVFGAARVPLSKAFAWMHGQMRGLPLAVRRIKI